MSTNSAVFTFGRFNPPTTGHEKLINKVISVAKSEGADAHVFTSQKFEPKKNPLKFEQKVFWLKKAFPSATISTNKKLINPFFAIDSITKKYDHITMIVGGDRVQDFTNSIETGFYKIHPEGKTIEFVSAGARAALRVGNEDVSGSFMRKYALANDYETFSKALPTKLRGSAGKKLFNQVRAGMGLTK